MLDKAATRKRTEGEAKVCPGEQLVREIGNDRHEQRSHDSTLPVDRR